MTKTILGIKGWDLNEYAISANAILGIRDSGKTYTGTEAAEELFDAGVPFIAFDPIGVWHSLRVPGKGKGYPVVVAGGKHGDLPLTRKNAGTLVRAAMSAEVSLVLDLFSIEMTKSDWRAIVREAVEILLHENSEHGLRHIFIEEAAEFVPQRVQDGLVFAAVEKLVRMGGNSKLGCTLINQRSADLNKSVLELCANVFVHRQTGKNTLLDLHKWLDVMGLDKAEQARIADSLPDLKSGQCWAFINDLKKPVRLQVPAKNSQHPDRRAVIAKGAEKRKPVAADAFVAQMTAKLAEKDKPKAAAPATSRPVEKINMADQRAQERALAAARAEGYVAGWAEGDREGFARGAGAALEQGFGAIRDALKAFAGVQFVPPKRTPTMAKVPSLTASAMKPALVPAARTTVAPRAPGGGSSGTTLPPGERAVLIAAAQFDGVDREQLSVLTGYKRSSRDAYIQRLREKALIEVSGSTISPTPAGFDALPADYEPLPTGQALQEYWLGRLPEGERRVLEVLIEAYPEAVERQAIDSATGYKRSSRDAYLQRMKAKRLWTAENGGVRMADALA